MPAIPGKRAEALVLALAAGILAACGGSGGTPSPTPAPAVKYLTEADVQRVIAQAVGEAQGRGERAHVAVVDRVGNLLASFAMDGAPVALEVSSGLGASGGLEGLSLPAGAAYSAIAKALTAAYLSSGGNAFSTRTAGQIVQDHFNPRESNQPSGPLFGVQFSQLRCSDVIRTVADASLGPKASPFGLSADPGGLPLYKNGVLVGGVGIESNGRYGLDLEVIDIDQDPEELVAVAGAHGFGAPADIRADRITADGRTLRFVDSEALASDPARAPAFPALPGRLQVVAGFGTQPLRAGIEHGTAASGIRPEASGALILVDGLDRNRHPVAQRFGAGGADGEVAALLEEARAVARRARGQIRRPLGSTAQVSIAAVDVDGRILGLVSSGDAPVFGLDVAVQKARTAAFFSSPLAAQSFALLPTVDYAPRGPAVELPRYLGDARAFLGDPTAFTGGVAWSARAIGNIHRPTFPDGLSTSPHGPFSTPARDWSPLNPGLQLDLVFAQFARAALAFDDTKNCVLPGVLQPSGPAPDPRPLRVANGIQIFPGGVPVYRGSTLVGAIGVSGDGVDQDDMIAFLGLHNAGARLGGAIGNAPAAMRADRLAPQGTRLRYVQCPQAPFVDSTEQDACAGK